MITRRALLNRGGGLLLAGAAFAGYSIVVEPNFMLDVTPYRVSPANWPADLNLRIAVISDLHACEPWMPPARIARIADLANALAPDLIVLLGDFSGGVAFASSVMPEQWAEALSRLRAPLGVFAVLGNHDWWHGALPQDPGDDGESVRRALRHMGAKLLENDVLRLSRNGAPVWLAGLADQMAIRAGAGHWRGLDDLPGTLAKITDDAPTILLAHEPFIFSRTPKRVALTLSGHTHGGQIDQPFAGPISRRTALSLDAHIWAYRGGRPPFDHFRRPGQVDAADPLHAPARIVQVTVEATASRAALTSSRGSLLPQGARRGRGSKGEVGMARSANVQGAKLH